MKSKANDFTNYLIAKIWTSENGIPRMELLKIYITYRHSFL